MNRSDEKKVQEKPVKIAILEGSSLGADMDFSPFYELGEVAFYPKTSPEEMPERVRNVDIIIANKLPMCAATLEQAEKLKLICLTATGINNLDGETALLRRLCEIRRLLPQSDFFPLCGTFL